MHFHPEGMRAAYLPQRGGVDLFFCHGLVPKSPQAKIMEAAARFDAPQLAALIAAHPDVPPDFQNGNGITPLMVAAARNNTDALHVLANHPLVNLSQPSRDGWTALHYAAYFGNAESVAVLLKRQADFKASNHLGETAFALAESQTAQDAFWAHKPFVHHMKRAAPDHPHLQPPPPPALPAAEKTAVAAALPDTNGKPADIPLTTLFLRAALNVGLSTSAAAGVYEELKKDIIAGRNDTLPDAYTRIEAAAQQAEARRQKIDFDWDGLLAIAAVAGNIPALVFIASKRDYLDSKPLTDALAAVIAGADDNPATAEAAQWLLRWGADANASGKTIRSTAGKAIRGTGGKAGTLAYQAFAHEKPQIFEAFCLHAKDLKSWHVSPEQLKWEHTIAKLLDADKPLQQKTGGADLSSGIFLLKLREQMHHTGQQKLMAHFKDALAHGRLDKMMAVYAETRTKRLLRNTLVLPREMGAAAIVLALENGHIAFAKRLAADGHSIKNLRNQNDTEKLAQLAKTDNAEIRDFLRAQRAGERAAPDILSIDDKFLLLRNMVSHVPVSGRGFGF